MDGMNCAAELSTSVSLFTKVTLIYQFMFSMFNNWLIAL
jgi:hypothetical protein